MFANPWTNAECVREIATVLLAPNTEERYDGVWVLRTNIVYNAETVAHVY
jgi:hypothetical protein